MFLGNLFEATAPKVTVIYPGRFQPFHKGHAAVYNHLVQKYGKDSVYIVTSDKTDNAKSPFSFDEKKKMMILTGVDSSKVVFSTQPYRAMEIVSKLDPSSVLMFAISEKDMAEDPRFQFAPKKDGSPSYFQPYKDIKQCKSLEHHAYMITVPTFEFTVLGKPANSASQIRAQFGNADVETKKKIVADLFGKLDPVVYNIMNNKLLPVPTAVGESTVVEASAHKKEMEAKRKKYEKEQDDKRAKEGETYHSGNAKVTKPPVNEFYDSGANKPEGGKVERIVRKALAAGTDVFVKGADSRKSGYIVGENPAKGFLVRGSGRAKFYVTFDDEEHKISKDANRLYVQPRNEWNASRELEEGVSNLDEISNDLSKNYMHGALHDTITGKKDRNPGISQAMNRISGTQYPLVPDTENPDPKIRSLAIAVEKMKDQLASLTGQPTTESTMKKVNELSSTTLGKYKKAASETLPKNMHQAGNRAQGVAKAKDKIHDKEVTSKAKAVGHPMVQEADHGGVPWGPVAQKEYFENWHKWDQAVRYNGGTTEHAGDGTYRAVGIDDGGIGQWNEHTGEGWIDLTGESDLEESDPGYNKHSFIGRIRRGHEANNKGWGKLGDLLRSDNEADARKELRKGNRYYNMTNPRKGSHTAGGFPKTNVPGLPPAVDEGRFVKGPGGVPLDRQGNPIPPKPPKAPAQKKLTLDDVWRKVEDVVGQIYPDGDPIDWMAPWLERHGIEDYKIGEIIDRAARKNGYKDMYDYWKQLDDQFKADAAYDSGIGESAQMTEWPEPEQFDMKQKQAKGQTKKVEEGAAPWAANWKKAALASKKAQQSPSGANHKRAAELHKKGASDPWGPYKDKHEEAYAKHIKAAKVYGESAGQVNELSVGTMDSYRSKRIAQGNKNLLAPHPAGEKAEKGINRAYNKTMAKKASTPSDPTLDRSDDYSTWKKGQNESKRSLKAIVREMHEQARQGDLRAVASCVRELVPFKKKESLKEGIMANVNKALTVAKRNSR